MSPEELLRQYDDWAHMDEEDDRTPAEELLRKFRNGQKVVVAAWLVCRTAEQPGYALCTTMELSRLMTEDEFYSLQSLMPEDA